MQGICQVTGGERGLGSQLKIFKRKDIEPTYLLRVTMISPERNMPDEPAASVNSLNDEIG